MSAIYVKEQGAKIGRRGERLVVSKKGNIIDQLPLAKVDQLILMGNVQLTSQATATLLQAEIEVVFLSSHGKFRGRLVGEGSKHARLRQMQLEMSSNSQRSLELAKAVVNGKIHNQRVVLQRQANRITSSQEQRRGVTQRPSDRQKFDRSLAAMQQLQERAKTANNLDSLRGYEGKAAVYYFEAIRTLLDPDWGFERREYYPPPDPFNALLSFGYSLLQKEVVAAVQVVGLDLYLGFFHEINYGRPSLALDLMEEWRPLIGDALCLELINRGSLTPDQFKWTRNRTRPVELGESGVSRVLQAYGSRLETKLYHPLAGPGGQTTIGQAIGLQARRLARVIGGKESAYEAIKAK